MGSGVIEENRINEEIINPISVIVIIIDDKFVFAHLSPLNYSCY